MARSKVLIVDDEAAIRDLFVDTLSPLGYEVLTASDGPSAIVAIERDAPGLAFIDIKMPGMDGVELLAQLQYVPRKPKVVMITGNGRDALVERALQLDTFACLMKPFSIRDIVEMTQIVDMVA